MSTLFNLARMSTTTTGTGIITLGSAVTGFLSFATAGVTDATVVTYAISDGSAAEIGTGTYTATGTTLSRTVIKSTNSNTAINLSGTAQVIITPSAEDILNKTQSASQTMSGPLSLGTSNAFTAGTIELGAASDTTIARSSAGIITVEGKTVALLDLEDQLIAGGARVTSKSLTTGSITLDPGDRPLQYITNGGAFTITAPANDGSLVLLVTNNSSAAAITFSGFTVGTSVGDALTTTNTSKFVIYIYRANSVAWYSIQALQ